MLVLVNVVPVVPVLLPSIMVLALLMLLVVVLVIVLRILSKYSVKKSRHLPVTHIRGSHTINRRGV